MLKIVGIIVLYLQSGMLQPFNAPTRYETFEQCNLDGEKYGPILLEEWNKANPYNLAEGWIVVCDDNQNLPPNV